MSVSIETTPGA